MRTTQKGLATSGMVLRSGNANSLWAEREKIYDYRCIGYVYKVTV